LLSNWKNDFLFLNEKVYNMITAEFAKQYSNEWIDAWNSHDLERILSHYTDNFTIESPMALRLFPKSNGVIAGKNNVRNYWKLGLEKIPDLKFEIIDVLTGVNTLTIYYTNTATNRKTVEVMCFDRNKKVNKVIANYSE